MKKHNLLCTALLTASLSFAVLSSAKAKKCCADGSAGRSVYALSANSNPNADAKPEKKPKKTKADKLFELGESYFKSNNYTEALKCFMKSAEKGHVKAQNNLGSMYTNGNGVAQNYTEALKWFRKSAEQGDAKAQYNLGVMYANGDGVAQNYTEALKWFRKAAEQGCAPAKKALKTL